MTGTAPRHPGVRFPPPLLFVGGFAVALLLHRCVRPLPIVAGGRPPGLVIGGWALVAAGLTMTAWAMLAFRRARTAIYPNQPASRLVARGPYRWSRNPMYVGLTAVYLGGMLLADTWWPLPILPLVLLLLVRLVIAREERYLAAAFGAEYDAYRATVSRWLGRRP